jgi:hypothetical protein
VRAVLAPQGLGVLGLGHAERIRAGSALPQGTEGHRGEPKGKGDGGKRDHPARSGAPRAVRGGERDAGEADREEPEERAQCTPLLQGAENLTATILPP